MNGRIEAEATGGAVTACDSQYHFAPSERDRPQRNTMERSDRLSSEVGGLERVVGRISARPGSLPRRLQTSRNGSSKLAEQIV